MTFEVGDLVIVTGTAFDLTHQERNNQFKPGTVCTILDIEGSDYHGDKLDWFSGNLVTQNNYRIGVDLYGDVFTWTIASNLQLAYAAG